MTDALIELSNVHFSYPDAAEEALRGVDLVVGAGEHLCILGSNGSGKSTLSRLINALLLPSSGTVRVCGIDAVAQPERTLELRQQVAMVFQNPDDQMVTNIVADDVAFGPENLGVPSAEIARRVDAALEAVGMLDRAHDDPASLSGGQRQRVAIASALAMEPRILVLDEPASMLDARGRRAIRKILAELHALGMTIVHITHAMEDALASDRAIVMKEGRIVREGAPSDVLADVQTTRAAGLAAPFCMKLGELLDGLGFELPRSTDAADIAAALAEGIRRARAARADDAAGAPQACEVAHVDVEGDGADSDMRPALVEFRDVSFSYEHERSARHRPRLLARLRGRAHAPADDELCVRNLSFTLTQGSLTALIGSTGSGKSTAVELACALKVPNMGTVVVDGIDTSDLTRRSQIRGRIGYVAQLPEHQLFAETVYDDIAFGPRNLGLDEDEVRARVEEAAGLVGLAEKPGILERSPFALSGGEQRAVSIAGVLALRTPLLVLDEPLAGLDPASQARMNALIAQLKAAGRTVLVVTHAIDDVPVLADQVVALADGRLVAAGTPRAVFARHADELPGVPLALEIGRQLAALGAPLETLPLTLDELTREVRHACLCR